MKLACPPLQLIPYLVCVHFFPRESVIDNNILMCMIKDVV